MSTVCYLVDGHADLIFAAHIPFTSDSNTREYEHTSLGHKEGAVMRELVYTHKLFKRKEQVNYNGQCRTTPFAEAVTLDGITKTAKEQDDYFKAKHPFPRLSQSEGCIQEVTTYEVDSSVIAAGSVLHGSVSDSCMSADYTVTSVPGTNAYLVVLENKDVSASTDEPFNFGCHISNQVMDAGAFKIINGTCVHEEDQQANFSATCPALKSVTLTCDPTVINAAGRLFKNSMAQALITTLAALLVYTQQ